TSNSRRKPLYHSEEIRSSDTLAVSRCHVFHGFWRNLWHRGHSARRWLWPRYCHPAAHARALEPANHVHDRRTLRRAAFRRRLLRMGAPRDGKLLGISGGMALASGLHLRHVDLINAFRDLSHAAFSLVCCWASRSLGMTRS